MTDQPKALAVTNYEKIKAMARNQETVARFIEVLGSKTNASSYITSAMLAVANSEDLQQCTPASIFNSVMRAAALRLSCDPATKQAHLVPFNNRKTGKKEAQFIPGYVGLNNLALRSGKYRYLNPGKIYEGQVVEIDQLTGKTAIRGEKVSYNVIGYFHYLETFEGYSHTLYMTIEELREHRRQYAPKNPTWESQFEAMCLKTVTRLNLLKYGLLDTQTRNALDEAQESIDEEAEIIPGGEIIDGTFTEADEQKAAEEAANYQEPKRSEADIMGDLGFDTSKAKAVEVTTPVKADAPATPMTLAEAMSEKTSEGKTYGSLSTDDLKSREHGINAAMKKPGVTEKALAEGRRKLQAISVILAARASKNDDIVDSDEHDDVANTD